MQISVSRSLVKSTEVTPKACSSHRVKAMRAVLPEPVGPMMSAWPMSFFVPPSGSKGSEA